MIIPSPILTSGRQTSFLIRKFSRRAVDVVHLPENEKNGKWETSDDVQLKVDDGVAAAVLG